MKSYAKIGIRPVIDGRWGGVRESLETQTMNMALAAKELIEKNVRHPDGTPVECVIAPCTIGGGEVCRCLCKRRRVRNALRHALLVLRLGDHGS